MRVRGCRGRRIVSRFGRCQHHHRSGKRSNTSVRERSEGAFARLEQPPLWRLLLRNANIIIVNVREERVQKLVEHGFLKQVNLPGRLSDLILRFLFGPSDLLPGYCEWFVGHPSRVEWAARRKVILRPADPQKACKKLYQWAREKLMKNIHAKLEGAWDSGGPLLIVYFEHDVSLGAMKLLSKLGLQFLAYGQYARRIPPVEAYLWEAAAISPRGAAPVQLTQDAWFRRDRELSKLLCSVHGVECLPHHRWKCAFCGVAVCHQGGYWRSPSGPYSSRWACSIFCAQGD